MNPIEEIKPAETPDIVGLWDDYIRREYKFTRDVHSLEMTAALFSGFALHNNAGETFLLIELLSKEKPSSGRESQLNLVLLLDRSHSMFGGPFLEVIKAAEVVIDQLTGRDSLSVIAFDHEQKLIVSSKRVLNKEEAKRRLREIEVLGGSTDLHGALKAGFREMREFSGDNTINKMILLTDGRPTIGQTDHTEFFSLAESIRDRGGSVSSVGVGLDYNEDLLSSIARLSGGGFYHSPRPREVKKIFKKEIAHFLNVSHRSIEVIITPKKWIKIKEIFGLPHRFENGKYFIKLPDLEKFTEQTVLCTIQYEPHPSGIFRLMELSTHYLHAGTGVEGELPGWVALRYVDDPTVIKKGKNPRVDKALLRRNVKSDLISTIHGIRTRVLSREDAQEQLRDYQRTLILSGNTKEARELGEAIQQLSQGEEESATKTLTQSTFNLERGRNEKDEPDDGGDNE